MKNRKEINWFIAITAIILGVTLFKHINFREFTLEDPLLDVVYLIVFAVSVYILLKERKQSQ